MLKKLISPTSILMMVVVLTSCSSLRKAELAAGNDPEKAIVEVMEVMSAAQQAQLDVLADEEFSQGLAYLNEAKQGKKQGDLTETILNNAAIAKALFEDAEKTAKTKETHSSRIIKARGAALDAGVRKSDALVSSMKAIDNDLKSETNNFSRSLSPEDFAGIQKQYFDLEAKAVQFTKLNSVNKSITEALENDADDLAPNSLRTASLDYKTAMNMIAQSPRSPDIYSKSVDDALASATQLFDVMNVILGAKGTPENIAVQIVNQKRALGELSGSVGKLEANLESANQTLQKKEGELKRTEGVLKSQEEQLAMASTQVRFQQAMDEARKMLSQDDALVYQQGNKLVFRLKRINFQSGAAEIPEFSKLLIAKTNAIIKKLDAEKVVVQGHTDSIGSTQVNKKLSTQRANAVANYLYTLKGGYKLQYVGYGEAHPISSNETAAGRATNRRVDLVVSVKQ